MNNGKGWITKESAVKWLREVWCKTTLAAVLKKRMLVLYDFKGYLTQKRKTPLNLNIDLLITSGSMISQSQIHNVVVNKPLKD